MSPGLSWQLGIKITGLSKNMDLYSLKQRIVVIRLHLHYFIKGKSETKVENTKVLLVEDDQDDAVLTLRALKKNNIENKVYVVRDGEEALDFLFCTNKFAKRDPHDMPQLILLDMELPNMNGLEVLHRVRADERTRRLPVVILSSSNEEQVIVESYKSGANSYVSKPTNFAQFMESVRQLGSYWLDSSGESGQGRN